MYPDRLASEEPTGMDLHTPFKKQNKIIRIYRVGHGKGSMNFAASI